jgi:hypothetical protein
MEVFGPAQMNIALLPFSLTPRAGSLSGSNLLLKASLEKFKWLSPVHIRPLNLLNVLRKFTQGIE